jgi:hypothetical protein
MPVERTKRRWVDNNKIGLIVIGWGCMDWIELGKDKDHR